MRIVHLVTRFARGGTEANVLNTIGWERRRGHDVTLVVGGESHPDALGSVDQQVDVHVVDALRRSLHPFHDARAYLAVCRLLRQLAPDVLHTHQSKAGVVGRLAPRRGGVVRVHTVHMMSFGPSYGSSSAALRLAERASARRSDVIATVGQQLAHDYLAAGVGRPDQYLVVRSPADVERFLATRSSRQALRASHRAAIGATDGELLAITAGALEPRKRQELVIDELRPLLQTGRARLVVAGDGPRRMELEALAHQLGVASKVHFAGHVHDLERWFAASDVYVHAATTEGVPQVVVQALAAGVPVAALATEGLGEIDGAPIEIATSSPGALRAAVERCTDCPTPLPPASFTPWTRSAIEEQLADLHARIDAVRPDVSRAPA